jgi:hypothetical protein
MWPRWPTYVLLSAVVLAWSAARADDDHKPADDPDSGFLEFLGSVDRLSDVNPDYIAQAEGRAQAAAANPPANPPPPRPPAPPPNAANGPGAQKNE